MSRLDEEAQDYHIGVHAHPGELDAHEWDSLLARQAAPTPFMRHAYLCALVDSGSATPDTGWVPACFSLRRQGRLEGAAVAWVKNHSYGEYVFDWAWADAYARHGLAYYPKLVAAVPFTPVPGTRLLALQADDRRRLLRALRGWSEQVGLSSAHLLFPAPDDLQAARDEGWLLRSGVQFHWEAPADGRWPDFAAFLASLQRDKRKKIQQERRRVAEAGIRFRALEGEAIRAADWDFFHQCYRRTYEAHRSTPYLTRDFFARVGTALAPHWLLFIAEREGQPLACSLLALDRAQGVAWGRYWGSLEPVSGLHFEACYYQPIEWCLRHGLRRFEGGAQGEHKMARGLQPVRTASAHWLAHPEFARAVEDFLAREGAGIDGYLDELQERSPFKAGGTP